MGAHAVSEAAAPSVCAGLQQALQQGWQRSFPLQASPWPGMATAVGASARELLVRAQQLGQARLLTPVQVRWGAAVRRHRWRLGFSGLDEAAVAALLHEAARTPSVLSVERLEGEARLWLHLEARETALLTRAQARLEAACARSADRCWVLQQDGPCPCTAATGPCADERLAADLETQGLPLVAHPFAALAQRLGDRTERAVLARLRDWQRQGFVQRLSLSPPFAPRPQRWTSWLQSSPPAASLPPGARASPWVDAASQDRGWLISLAGDVTPTLQGAPRARWSSRVVRLRPQARFFAACDAVPS